MYVVVGKVGTWKYGNAEHGNMGIWDVKHGNMGIWQCGNLGIWSMRIWEFGAWEFIYLCKCDTVAWR